MPRRVIPLPARFWSKVDVLTLRRCWRWKAKISRLGYGHFKYLGKVVEAHRIAFLLTFGYLPEDMELDHTCRDRSCCNPFHLEPVTHLENMARGAHALKTHCLRGHEFTPENTQRGSKGSRNCKTCAALRHREQRKVRCK